MYYYVVIVTAQDIGMENNMRILLISPGTIHSTYDCYKYYLDAMKENTDIGEVQGFNYHNLMMYHTESMKKYFPHYSVEDRNSIVSVRAARELLLDIITFRPDVVFVVAGGLIPIEVYKQIRLVREELNRKFAIAIYLTECPYLDREQKSFADYADVLFLNDKYSLKFFDPKGNHYIEYLPHSYNPKVHNTGIGNSDLYEQDYKSDVFFGATAFRERVDMMASIEWDGIDLRLVGNWDEWADTEAGSKLQPFAIPDSRYLHNSEYAKYYRNTKIALNVHRTRSDINGDTPQLDNYSDAYSIGPRIYEAVACGAFVLTDYRKEAEDLFGDTIEFFENDQQMEEKIRYWLDPQNEQERINRVQAAMGRISKCTFADRLNENIMPVLKEVLRLRRNNDG